MYKKLTTMVAIATTCIAMEASAATVLNGTFNVTAVNVTNVNSSESQALRSNYDAALAGTLGNGGLNTNSVYSSDTFTYTGALDFDAARPNPDAQTISGWLGTGTPGGVSGLDGIGGLQLSKGSIGNETATTTFFLFELVSDLTASIFTVRHDDGVELYDDGTSIGGFVGPNTVRTTTVEGFDGGKFSILYVATNSNPSILKTEISPVPVPASLPLLVGALGFAAWVSRRRKPA